VDSDYRVSGVSLSSGKPDLSLSLSYDHESGLYGGLSVIGAEGIHGGTRVLGYVEYAGYATRLDSDNTIDFGVSNINAVEQNNRTYSIEYTQIYAGIIRDDFTARVYYSPNFIGEGFNVVYIDLGKTVKIAQHWRLFGHAGLLTPFGGARGPDSSRYEHFDFRAGVAAEIKGAELQLAWTATRPKLDYPVGHRQAGDALELGAAIFF